jgi:DNA-binding beta-propeller fold protein YncE
MWPWRHKAGLVRIPVGLVPASLACDERFVWVANSNDNKISRINPANNVVTQIAVGNGPTAIDVGGGFAWVALAGDAAVVRVDAVTGEVDGWRQTVGKEPISLCYAEGFVWVGCAQDHLLMRLDPGHRSDPTVLLIDGRPGQLRFGHGALWMTAFDVDRVLRVEPRLSQIVRAISVGPNPFGLAITTDSVWVTASNDKSPLNKELHRQDAIWRIDARTNEPSGYEVGGGPCAVAVDESLVWVAQGLGTRVLALDASTGKVVKSIDIGNQSTAIAVGHGSVWAAQPFAIGARSNEPVPGIVTKIPLG